MSGEASGESFTLTVSGGTYAQSDVGRNITINNPTFGLKAGANTDKGQLHAAEQHQRHREDHEEGDDVQRHGSGAGV